MEIILFFVYDEREYYENNYAMGGIPLILLDYIMNLSIFSLMVSTPLVIRSFIKLKPFKRVQLWGGIYGGIVSCFLVMLSFQQQGYTYDIRYAIVILIFAYFGPMAGLITGGIALSARLFASGHWMPAIIGWSIIMIGFSIIHLFTKRLTPVKKCFYLYGAYIVIYLITVPLAFNVFRDKPLFHLQYVLFVMFGVMLGGLLIESYLKLHRIITEKDRMEVSLAESEAKYRLIAENTSDLIKIMGKDQLISYFSPSHEQVLGYQNNELEKVELCKYIHPDDIFIFQNTIKALFEKKESLSMEFRFKHKDGRWIEFESRCMPVRGEQNSVEYIVMISRDISERKKAEGFLLQSEKLSIVGELAAGVAHEIRNPLTTIKGFVQLYKAENSSIVYNDLLLSELERIETITSELLSLGKPQAVQLNRANLRELIEKTLELLSPEALMKDIQFIQKFEEAAFFITCEKNQLKQVFLNVLKNAMEAMPDGGEITIELRKGAEGNCVISFQDQGCGIPEELLPRLGEPFYTLKEKGTGLGLMICKKIIKQHHGSITYQSKEKEGTLVEIKLPMVK
ncbi:PAS/PAC sensor signal transduction histidine kinase [Neobacillus vireti LMG 21834]|uniref:histidine kinase n=1 Tax=Neobacillus vireti LMG 21834 TaxID=1131730 RepID=A0AB94INK6_9BACI|nr:PAS/PAC sensor signal transduction histidine kinase [Neobacillus vireti LMG 21834]